MSIITYSTGPVENAINTSTLPGESRRFWVKALNNGSSSARLRINLYRLNGTKVLVATKTFKLAAGSSTFHVFNVAQLVQFEIQIKTDSKKVLVSGWGKNASGRLVAAHRYTPEEFAKKIY